MRNIKHDIFIVNWSSQDFLIRLHLMDAFLSHCVDQNATQQTPRLRHRAGLLIASLVCPF